MRIWSFVALLLAVVLVGILPVDWERVFKGRRVNDKQQHGGESNVRD